MPDLEPGPAEIEITAVIDRQLRQFHLPVEILEQALPRALPISRLAFKPEGGYRVLKDDAEVEVFTEDRAAPIGLSSTVFLRASGEYGGARQIDLEVELEGSEKKSA